MNRGRLISVLVLLAVLGGFFAVYQFYFKEQLAKYARDEAERAKLEAAFNELKTTFQGANPEELTRLWRANVQPWNEAVAQRAVRFDIQEWYEHEPYPEDGHLILKFWFDEQVNKMFTELYQQVNETPGLWRFPAPQQLRTMLGIPTLQEIENQDLPQNQAYRMLRRLAFLGNVVDLVLGARVTALNDIVLWPKRSIDDHAGLLELQTVGLDFTITAKDFVDFIDNKLRTADKYFTIDAMRVAYPYIAHPQEPQLQVQMLLTIGDYRPRTNVSPGGSPGAVAAGPAGGAPPSAEAMYTNLRMGRRAESQPPPEEPGMIGKAWKWFKRVVLVMN